MMEESTGRQKYILIVDDEPLVSQSIWLLLEGQGYIVESAKNGFEALAMFEPDKFDMVFTDYLMPDIRGDRLAEAIKRISPKQPVVMITAFPEKLQSSTNALGGVESFICKPFDAQVLRTALERYAARP